MDSIRAEVTKPRNYDPSSISAHFSSAGILPGISPAPRAGRGEILFYRQVPKASFIASRDPPVLFWRLFLISGIIRSRTTFRVPSGSTAVMLNWLMTVTPLARFSPAGMIASPWCTTATHPRDYATLTQPAKSKVTGDPDGLQLRSTAWLSPFPTAAE
jgi:hypothetical protein